MLIRRAEILDLSSSSTRVVDVRVDAGRVSAVGNLEAITGEVVVDAGGGLLVPGLADHHVHLLAYAAALTSVPCGPPDVADEAQLAKTLRGAAGDGWIRGVGYHDSVAGEIDAAILDRYVPERPVRIQHRSGRLWIFNSLGLDVLAEAGFRGARPSDGRFYDADASMMGLVSDLPSLGDASNQLAAYGVTALNDMTPANDDTRVDLLRQAREGGVLRQKLRVSGLPSLSPVAEPGIERGEVKFHLHEDALPAFDDLCAAVRDAHEDGRCVAVHCVTETVLVFTLAALREAGGRRGDRIEHASLVPPGLIPQLAELDLLVVTQPNFVAERGDDYLRDIPAAEHDWLYRCASLVSSGVRLSLGTDMPFGHADPWRAMRGACERRTPGGEILGEMERLSPESALGMYLGRLDAPAVPRKVEVGEPADFCLLDDAWDVVRDDLNSARVVNTWVDGRLAFSRD